MVDMYRSHPAVQGIEPVNEPWQYTPIKTLKVSQQASHIKPNQIKSIRLSSSRVFIISPHLIILYSSPLLIISTQRFYWEGYLIVKSKFTM